LQDIFQIWLRKVFAEVSHIQATPLVSLTFSL